MRDYIERTSDPNYKLEEVTGYLLCGDLVDTYQVRGKRENLANSRIYVRRYVELLDMVRGKSGQGCPSYNDPTDINE